MDGAFAKRLSGAGVEAPADALGALRPLLEAPMLCSRQRPFGIHADLTGHSCPRCGWTPKRRGARRGGSRAAGC